MIKLNRITDYAVVVLAQMARDPKTKVTATQLAEDSRMPLPTVAKLLKDLTRERVLTSVRGAAGGYKLRQAPEDISVLRIIRALEGPIALTACVDGAVGGCNVESLCPMRGNWDQVNQAIGAALENVTLADMAVPALPFSPGPGERTRAIS